MEAKDVLNLPWKNVTDWSELSASYADKIGQPNQQNYVSVIDVNVFVENLFRDIARKLNIPYKKLKPILIKENRAFYKLKETLFFSGTVYGKSTSRLIQLENTLRVPDVSFVENAHSTNNVSTCLKLFEGLSDIEKAVFLQKLKENNVKV